MSLWKLIVKMLTAGSNVSSKRAGGLLLIVIYSWSVTVMAVRGDYSLVKEAGILAASLLGLGLLDKYFKR